jgi:hypothetical protein
MKRILTAALGLALIAAACGGDRGAEGVASLETNNTTALAAGVAGDGDGTTEAGAADAEAAFLEFTQCLRDQGLDIEDPDVDAAGNLSFGGRVGPEGIDREAFRAAREACAEILEGVSLEFREFDRTEIEDSLIDFASCMRSNGYDMPDPDFSNFGPGGGGGDGGPFGEIDPQDPAFIAAGEACRDILAGFDRGRGPGGGDGG